MFTNSEAIVLNTVKFKEKDLIVHFFTQSHGVLTFMIKNAFSLKSKNKVQYFYPFNILKINFDYHSTKNFQYVKDFNLISFNDSSNSIVKHAYLSFHLELVNQIKPLLLQSDELFDYYKNIVVMHHTEINYYQILIDLLNLLTIMGHQPNLETYFPNSYLNLYNGHFETTYNPKTKSNFQESELIYKLQNNEVIIENNNSLRSKCIATLIQYIQIHLKENIKINSIEIFRGLAGT